MVLARRAESLELDAQINTGASYFSSELLARLLYLQVIGFPIFLIIEIANENVEQQKTFFRTLHSLRRRLENEICRESFGMRILI